MAAEYGFLTEQTGDGKHISVASAADVHIVPNGEKHEVTVLANATTAEDITVKIDGETTGIVEALSANKTRVIWTGVLDAQTGTAAINCESGGSTALVWGKYRKL